MDQERGAQRQPGLICNRGSLCEEFSLDSILKCLIKEQYLGETHYAQAISFINQKIIRLAVIFSMRCQIYSLHYGLGNAASL